MATTNILAFQTGIAKFVDQAKEERRERTKAVAMRALNGVVQGTRVDTGRAKGNWQIGEARPPTGELDRTDKDGNATITEGQRKIEALSGDETIWLHNGVPYINKLEEMDKMVAGNVEALKTWLRSQ